jgi:hypothetical protein
MAMLLMHPVSHDVRAIDDQDPCCTRAVWSVLVDWFGYEPFDPNARAYAARSQLVLATKGRKTT